jgi:hypothetical protein
MRSAFIAVCVVLAGANGSAFAQGPGFGILVGVNSANLKVDVGGPSVNFDSRTGLVAGVFGVLPVASRVAIEPGVFYSSQGAKVSGEEFGGSAGSTGTIKLDYVQVPVLVRVSAPLAPSASLRVFAGPSFGFRQSAKVRAEGTDEDIKEDVESFDAGMVFGAGFDVLHFLVDARYTLGLKNAGKDPAEGESVKNRVFSIMAGFRF